MLQNNNDLIRFLLSTNGISQIRQITERFIYQSGFFKYFQNATSGIDKFFILGFKNQLYGNEKNQIEQDSIMVYWIKNIHQV